MTTSLEAFASREDLEQYESNGLLLFALELRFGIDDIASVAVTALTDGGNDRKCDLVYIDPDSRTAILAQGYFAQNSSKSSAPANKASTLSVAASWILGNERANELGASLRAAADDLHQAIRAGEVDVIELWYSHNLPESKNVASELERASAAAKAIVSQHYPERSVEIRHLEIGRSLLDEWYASTRTPILVTGELEVPVESWFEERGDGWHAVCTSVPAEWLHELFNKHGDRLFSANVRGYMPSRKTAQNINFGIEQTARMEPGRFWAFNNGVTALVNAVKTNKRKKSLRLSGIAVVNGAQTTGALARVEASALTDARVMIRFVQATNAGLVEDIIRFNNSQNPIKPSDFRSGDRNQERLRGEFQRIPNATYLGARRGGAEDRARRPSNLISSDTAAQALAAFHQDPGTAYHDLRRIWDNDEAYARYFADHTTATHIVHCYSLWRAVAEKKSQLISISEDVRTADDKEALDYLRKRGSLHLLVAAIANSAEIFLGRAIPNSFALSFGVKIAPEVAVATWAPLVDALLPFAQGQLGPVFDNGGLRRKEAVGAGIANFRSVVASTKRANSSVFEDFRGTVEFTS